MTKLPSYMQLITDTIAGRNGATHISLPIGTQMLVELPRHSERPNFTYLPMDMVKCAIQDMSLEASLKR